MQDFSLDNIDRNILRILQQDARISNTALSEQVGLSKTPCAERVRRLEKLGIITGYKATINPRKVGYALLVYVEISLQRTSQKAFEEFRQAARQIPQVLECHLVAGNCDFLIKARLSDMTAYGEFLEKTLLGLPHVAESRSFVVINEVKDSQQLPF